MTRYTSLSESMMMVMKVVEQWFRFCMKWLIFYGFIYWFYIDQNSDVLLSLPQSYRNNKTWYHDSLTWSSTVHWVEAFPAPMIVPSLAGNGISIDSSRQQVIHFYCFEILISQKPKKMVLQMPVSFLLVRVPLQFAEWR